jgi:hypothetical protein
LDAQTHQQQVRSLQLHVELTGFLRSKREDDRRASSDLLYQVVAVNVDVIADIGRDLQRDLFTDTHCDHAGTIDDFTMAHDESDDLWDLG